MARDLYRYVGPPDILQRSKHSPGGARITSTADLAAWIVTTGQRPDATGLLPVTFVVDADGDLRLADRHSEHVACARGQPVRSAGEMFFEPRASGWNLAAVSNQSTGYCPEPESWSQVAAALDPLPLSHPGRFTYAYVFRRCPICGQLNIVKDEVFECVICNADLPLTWNVAMDW
jgi:hypothetical protein